MVYGWGCLQKEKNMSGLTAISRPRSALDESLSRASVINSEHISDLHDFSLSQFARLALDQSDIRTQLLHEKTKRKELKSRVKMLEGEISKFSQFSPGYGPSMSDLHDMKKRLEEEQQSYTMQLERQFVKHVEIQSVILRVELRLDQQQRQINEVEASFVENCSSSPTCIQAPLSAILEGQKQILDKLQERQFQLPLLVQRPSPEVSTAVPEEKSKPQ